MGSSTFRLVPAVDKAARILAELAREEPLGISELARRITASKGTVRDILLTLALHDLARRDEDGRFRRGGRRDLAALAGPYLRSLMEEFGETAILGAVRDGQLEIVAREEPPTDIHMTAPLGRRLPLGAGAHGKALMAGERVGYDDEELLPGVRAAAAAVRDGDGAPLGAVIVVGFKERLDLRTLRRVGERCAVTAEELSRRLGAP